VYSTSARAIALDVQGTQISVADAVNCLTRANQQLLSAWLGRGCSCNLKPDRSMLINLFCDHVAALWPDDALESNAPPGTTGV
jgi:hypothetical protein